MLSTMDRERRFGLANPISALSSSSERVENTLRKLGDWIIDRDYSGYEPYDILNSPYLKAGMFRRPPLSFALIQFGKRIGGRGMRELLRVPASKNPKALGLMLAAFCDLMRGGQDFSPEAMYLKSELKRLRSPKEEEYCWGYDWDYMSLRGTKLPAYSPNAIASYFCGEALLDMGQVFNDGEATEMGQSVGRFMVTRLNRPLDTPEQVCFSYTPADRTLIYNSSALTAAYLARAGKDKPEYLRLARRAMNYLRSEQLPEGGWYYGARRRQRWIDGFHTSYNLCAMREYQQYTGDDSFDECIRRGHAYYGANFFAADEAPKYFDNQLYPVDIHSCSQAILHYCASADDVPSDLAKAVAVFEWTQNNMMQDDRVYIFQRHRTWINRTAYMRWGQAWMFRAMARLWLQLRNVS